MYVSAPRSLSGSFDCRAVLLPRFYGVQLPVAPWGGGAVARANALHQLLTQWSAGGMELPLTIGELAAPCGVDDAGALLAALLGDVTARLLPSGLQTETILPKQVAQVLAALLARLEAQFLASAAAKTKAAAAYAELAAKRPRHMP